jgi:hypothetical protein
MITTVPHGFLLGLAKMTDRAEVVTITPDPTDVRWFRCASGGLRPR